MLRGQVAIVTGGARGIGLATSRALAQAGAAVALADLEIGQATASARELCEEGYDAFAYDVDVSDEGQVASMVRQVLARWGRIDVLVNNAGICLVTPVEEITGAEWDRVLGVNLKGMFLCSKAVIPTMQERGSGRIVNIASSAGQMGGLAVGVHYSASKAGVLGLTKGLARKLAPSIQVNAVAPGPIDSAMTSGWSRSTKEGLIKQIPRGRMGKTTEVAAAVLFLASEAASFITGQTLSVNGGLLMP